MEPLAPPGSNDLETAVPSRPSSFRGRLLVLLGLVLLGAVATAYLSGVRLIWRGFTHRLPLAEGETISVALGRHYNLSSRGETWRELTVAYRPRGGGGGEEARAVLEAAVPLADSAGDTIIAVHQQLGRRGLAFSRSHTWRFRRVGSTGEWVRKD